MQYGIKLLIAAILSLSIGVAFASPLFLADMKIVLLQKLPEGPKADFDVDIVYVNFKNQEQIDAATTKEGYSTIDYQIVVNITNTDDIEAKLGMIEFTAAQNITIIMGAARGGSSISPYPYGKGVSTSSATIEGLWLDNEWHNITWIPGAHPEGYNIAMRNSEGYFL